jgi:nucleotide-binding universal stress UspA family protein
MKKILVPTDFTTEADYALEAAAKIAATSGASIELLHIVEDLPHETFSPAGDYIPQNSMDKLFVMKLIEKAHEQLHTRMKDKKLAGIHLTHEVKVGNVYKHIAQSISDERVDLIVMGTKGDSGLHELLVGSNTEKVVRFATCPVLSIGKQPEAFELKNVVLAANFEENYSSFLHKLLEWQKLFEFSLHIVHINTPLNFDSSAHIEEKMAWFSKKHQLQNYTFTIVNEFTYEAGIINFASKTKADMIVMLTHGRRGLAYFMDGSITGNVVNHANVPVLSYRILS